MGFESLVGQEIHSGENGPSSKLPLSALEQGHKIALTAPLELHCGTPLLPRCAIQVYYELKGSNAESFLKGTNNVTGKVEENHFLPSTFHIVVMSKRAVGDLLFHIWPHFTSFMSSWSPTSSTVARWKI